jgi:hypothetical protein
MTDFLKKKRRRQWREISPEDAGLAAADVPKKYVEDAQCRIAELLCSVPSIPLALLRAEFRRQTPRIAPLAFDAGLRAHVAAGRMVLLRGVFRVSEMDEAGNISEFDEDRDYVMPHKSLSAWWKAFVDDAPNARTVEVAPVTKRRGAPNKDDEHQQWLAQYNLQKQEVPRLSVAAFAREIGQMPDTVRKAFGKLKSLKKSRKNPPQ